MTTMSYELQGSSQLIPLDSDNHVHANDNNIQLTQLKYKWSTNPDINEQLKITRMPHVGDYSQHTNEISAWNSNSIVSFNDATDIESSGDLSYIIPLKIIIPVEHVHKSSKTNSYERYNHILLNADNISYHGHIHSDNPEILFPLNHSPERMISTVNDDNEATTNQPNIFDSDEIESDADLIHTDKNDVVLVDSQGYRYELKDHIQISDDQKSNVIEFDEIVMAHSKPSIEQSINQMSKRIHDNTEQTTTDYRTNSISADQYEEHYAKIFQWLHYHL